MTKILAVVYDFVWGAPALVLILGVGVWFTASTGFAQLRLFPAAAIAFFRNMLCPKGSKDGTSGFQALCTALAATAGSTVSQR